MRCETAKLGRCAHSERPAARHCAAAHVRRLGCASRGSEETRRMRNATRTITAREGGRGGDATRKTLEVFPAPHRPVCSLQETFRSTVRSAGNGPSSSEIVPKFVGVGPNSVESRAEVGRHRSHPIKPDRNRGIANSSTMWAAPGRLSTNSCRTLSIWPQCWPMLANSGLHLAKGGRVWSKLAHIVQIRAHTDQLGS